MQFTTMKDQLSKGLSAVRSVIPKRTTLTVLSHVMIEARNGTVRLTGTDLDITVGLYIDADVADEGAMTIPARSLGEFVKGLPAAARVSVARENNRLKLACGNARFNVEGFDKDEFPSCAVVSADGAWRVNAGDLKRLVSYSAFAVSTEESRPILCGVLWERRHDVMRMVATTGTMLSKITMPVPDDIGEGDAIVPPTAFAQAGRLFDASDMLTVSSNDHHMQLLAEDGSFVVARLIDGPYPNYEKVFDRKQHGVATIDRAALIHAVERVGVIKNKSNPAVSLTLDDCGVLGLMSKSPDIGEIHDEMHVVYTGEPLSIGFNFQYLLQVLKHQPTDEVRIRFGGSDRAATLEPIGWDDPASYVQLVMPLRLNS